jgi:hypothetical protein
MGAIRDGSPQLFPRNSRCVVRGSGRGAHDGGVADASAVVRVGAGSVLWPLRLRLFLSVRKLQGCGWIC